MIDPSLLRLFISQCFLVYYLLILIPIKPPKKRNLKIVIACALIITIINAVLIHTLGLLPFYVRYYFFTLSLPIFIVLSVFAVHKGIKLVFAVLSVLLFGNIAIINGILASYVFFGENTPLIDTGARILTYIIFLPIIYQLRIQYLKMTEILLKGWLELSFVLLMLYVLKYYLIFIPTPLFDRPEYFFHIYIVIVLSLLIYTMFLFLFVEIQSKADTDRDKKLLAIQVESMIAQSSYLISSEEKVNILRHDIRHQLSIINELILKGDTLSASLLLNDYESQLPEISNPVYCDNVVINAALIYYFKKAASHQIMINSKLNIPEKINVSAAELAIVFANAIENAIHACLTIEDISLREITLISRYSKHSLAIEISNPYFKKVTFNQKGVPIATVEGHGTGIKSMQAFSSKNDALLEFEHKDNHFSLRLLINSV